MDCIGNNFQLADNHCQITPIGLINDDKAGGQTSIFGRVVTQTREGNGWRSRVPLSRLRFAC